ncbi:MAG: UDP-N-acetylmuramoyl-L-alanyl-D-glutamate--2,6-diaminopimelate ligase [Azovibrio sp.]|nr:UDP-N-acetylmuramoyl-L-alanyl-D-glutamate--2,6-diaminopimelate ligase [Azovibrio sp.]
MSAVERILAALGDVAPTLTGAMDDSRQVRPGELFLAYPGHDADGRRYIAAALTAGARAVCWEPGGDFAWPPEWRVPNLAVPGLRALAGPLAHALAGRPSEAVAVLAVTGTNGKTSISQWLAKAYPEACASIGTLGAGFPGQLQPTGFTTPEATTLARLLAEQRRQGAKACALEASSIGIEEGRLNGCKIDTAIFSNLTRDHLDYHGSMETYAAAKEKLFHWPDLRLALINLDDPFGQHLARRCSAARLIGYSLCGRRDLPAVLRAERLVATATGLAFELVTPWGDARVETGVLGHYNIANLLAVAGVLLDLGLSPAETAARLAALTPPPGRMERHGGVGAPLVVVDYAHTPDALANVLAALRPLATARGGQLWCVFGCGGDRDPGKRPLMGEVAARLADRVWLTSDNPRSENPLDIIAAIRAGAPAAQVEPDRGRAIAAAIAAAGEPDVILIAGKGHEPYQEIAGVRHPFADGEQARLALAARHENRKVRECAGI